MPRDVAVLGQVFTPPSIVSHMLGLLRNRGAILEPSCGDGAFFRALPADRRTGVEIDARIAPEGAEIADFFAWTPARRFASIIGNPPFVRFQDVRPETRDLLPVATFDRRTNLYVFFIWRCLDLLEESGEIVFITPRDFLNATHSRTLNERLWREGAFTHWEELGDARVFPGYGPTCAIWRWEKGRTDRRLDDGREMALRDGQLLFDARGRRLGDVFDVRVGAVSGADALFAQDSPAALPFVASITRATGRLRRLVPDLPAPDPSLLPHRAALQARQARPFGDDNWWRWTRGLPKGGETGPRIYVNAKTRHPAPFFLHDCPRWDGSILALFPKNPALDLPSAVKALNALDWGAQGLRAGGRLLLGQRSLSNATLPDDFPG
jgi:adenine-specific DNA-methyltransferase